MDKPCEGWAGGSATTAFTGGWSRSSILLEILSLHPLFLPSPFPSIPFSGLSRPSPTEFLFLGEPVGLRRGPIVLRLLPVTLCIPPRPLRTSVSRVWSPAAVPHHAHAGAVLAWLWRCPTQLKLICWSVKGSETFPVARLWCRPPLRLPPGTELRARAASCHLHESAAGPGRAGGVPSPPTSLSGLLLLNQNC